MNEAIISSNWYIEEGFDKHYGQPTLKISRPGIREFCTIWSGGLSITTENRTNAQLIAHAPQMLEMLKEYVELWTNGEIKKEGVRFDLGGKMQELIQRATTIK